MKKSFKIKILNSENYAALIESLGATVVFDVLNLNDCDYCYIKIVENDITNIVLLNSIAENYLTALLFKDAS